MIELLGPDRMHKPTKAVGPGPHSIYFTLGAAGRFGPRGRFNCIVRLSECGFISIQGKRATLAMIVSASLRFSSKATKHF